MANKIEAKDRESLTELHRLMGMSPGQVRRELKDLGYEVEAELEGLRRLGRVMAATHATQIEREESLAADAKTFPIYADAVAAGEPAWAGGNGASGEASLLDVLNSSDAEDLLWARVSGWSMRDEGINDGDMVLVNVKLEAKDGDLVLAHLAGLGQVVKRLRVRDGFIALESANPEFEPIVVDDSASMRIHGVVVGRAGKL